MSNLRIVTGTDPYFPVFLDKLVAQYNKEMPFPFSTNFRRPEVMFLVEFKGIGGMLVDTLDESPFRSVAQLLFVSKEHRGKGYGRRLVETAEAISKNKDGLFVGAYFDMGDPDEFWEKLGYDRQVILNGGLAYVCDSDEVCFPNSSRQSLSDYFGINKS